MNSRQKGNRTVRKGIEILLNCGYIVDTVEKHGRFTKYKDLFSKWFEDNNFKGGFDVIALNEYRIRLIQFKTNQPGSLLPYKAFASVFGNVVYTELWCWKNRKGFVIYKFNKDGTYTRLK